MKKIISTILMMALIMFAIPHIVFASGETVPRFSLSTVKGGSGDTVCVNLDVTNNPGITALQIQIGYSAEDVELVSVEDKKLFGDAISFGQQDANPFTISWFSSVSKDMYNNGTLAVLKFRIRNGAESSSLNLSYDQENVFNIDLTSIPFHTIDGKVIVTSKPVGTTTPKPVGTTAPKPVGTATPKPVGTATPKPVGTATPKPVGTAIPTPTGTVTPEPMSSSEPQNVNNMSLEIGSSVKDANGAVYKVVSAGMVEYSKPARLVKTKANIPAEVSINGKRYKVTSIAARAFSGYKMLKTVTIGENVATIGANAFYNCKRLGKITIPEKVRKIGARAFANCKKLNKITIKSKKLKANSIGKQAFKGGYSRPTVKVPKKYKSRYRKALKIRGMSKYAIYT